MPVSSQFRDRIESHLSDVVPVRFRAMFGGVGIYSGDLFFALLDDDTLYFKVDDTNRLDFEQLGMNAFDPAGDGRVMQYYRVPEAVLTDRAVLREWIDKALDVARRKVKKTRRKKKP